MGSVFDGIFGPPKSISDITQRQEFERLMSQAPNMIHPDHLRNMGVASGPAADTAAVRGMKVLRMRLGLEQTGPAPLPFFQIHVTSEVAYLFIVDRNGKPMVLEDDPGLFPSDTLVTQVRLLIC